MTRRYTFRLGIGSGFHCRYPFHRQNSPALCTMVLLVIRVYRRLVGFCHSEKVKMCSSHSLRHQPLLSGGGGLQFLCWLGLVSPLCTPLIRVCFLFVFRVCFLFVIRVCFLFVISVYIFRSFPYWIAGYVAGFLIIVALHGPVPAHPPTIIHPRTDQIIAGWHSDPRQRSIPRYAWPPKKQSKPPGR